MVERDGGCHRATGSCRGGLAGLGWREKAVLWRSGSRDALTRMARYKQLCSPEEMRLTEGKEECVIEFVWLHATEDTPLLLTDAAFAAFVDSAVAERRRCFAPNTCYRPYGLASRSFGSCSTER